MVGRRNRWVDDSAKRTLTRTSGEPHEAKGSHSNSIHTFDLQARMSDPAFADSVRCSLDRIPVSLKSHTGPLSVVRDELRLEMPGAAWSESIVDRVASIEKTLGIYELAQFTPTI